MADDIPIEVVSKQDNPLQHPGKHRLLQTQVRGGPSRPADRRMYFTRKELEAMLDIANNSLSGRVQLDQVGFEVKVWQDPRSKHIYQTWSIISRPPKPEHSIVDKLVSGTNVK